MMAWIKIEIPLVLMLPNSTTLNLAGNWKSNPGDRRMNKPAARITGAQSAPIFYSLLQLASVNFEHENNPTMDHVCGNFLNK